MRSETNYLILSENCSLRHLETPCVFDKVSDELYELDIEAFEFLLRCDGTRTLRELGGMTEFVDYCFKENILTAMHGPHVRHLNSYKSPANSLRYLELHLTDRCNLKCRHCYLGEGEGADLELLKVFKVLEEFDAMQGIRLLLSGGEPMLHKGFWYINEKLAEFGFRSALLTNGTQITRDAASRLKVQEAQVSLDGMRESHDELRGRGSFVKAVEGVQNLLEAGIKVSVATTINAINAEDMGELGKLIDSLGVDEWNVDMPTPTGRFADNPDLFISPDKAAPFMSLGFGGSHHGSDEGYACGSHLCAVGARGQVAKCGFYLNNPVGKLSEGLAACWDRLRPIETKKLSCDCKYVEVCSGGCRFRAATYTSEFGPDPVKCYNLGVLKHGTEGGDPHDYQKTG